MQKSKEKVLIFFGIFTAVDGLGKLGLNKRGGGAHPRVETEFSSAATVHWRSKSGGSEAFGFTAPLTGRETASQ